jgi:putative DNA primase/helicase
LNPTIRKKQNVIDTTSAPQLGASNRHLDSSRASSFEPRAISWLWPNRFALGLIAGLPDEGKGQVFANMAATVTQGGRWPCNEGEAPQGNVLLLTAEDGIEDTVAPRLMAAGADLDCVEIVRMVRDQNGKRMFNLADDLDLLRQKIHDAGNVRLVQIDPISAYLGDQIDSFRTTAVRSVLAPLVDLADEMNVSIVGMLHFNKKLDVNNALLRISDSLAFGATARHVYAVVDDAENKRKLFVKGKNNLAIGDNKSLAYRFRERDVAWDMNGQVITAPYIVWEGSHVEVTASQAMAANKSPGARDQAKKFLTESLADGPVLKTDLEEAADAHGISNRTLYRAKDELGVIVEKGRGVTHGKWTWRLPDQRQNVAVNSHKKPSLALVQ